MECYTIIQKIGEGGFAKVYMAEVDDNDITFDISKVQPSQQAIKVHSTTEYSLAHQNSVSGECIPFRHSTNLQQMLL